jgi:hypothetical protein
MKIDIETVYQVLGECKVPKEQADKVINNLQAVAEEEKQEKESLKTPKAKWEFGVVLYDANNELDGKEFTASIYQIKDGEDHNLVLPKLCEAAKIQNEMAKRKKHLLDTIGNIFSSLKSKFAKEKGVRIKTKEPVRVLVSNNKIQ